ncbi:HAD family hydrolase [Spirillospora sp. NBC_01491]|uniref:HAD family hydrolase n=1 Tax=Spirillospora sp. NBC_01491 TaxID=2976007 RepID=UPI002E37C73A|nr:HAD family hydrolase [Spirillospora sp. NBC_01491]
MIEAVLWDVDDTLFDFSGSDRLALLRHFEAEGRSAGETALGHWRQATRTAYGRLAAGELTYAEYQRERVRGFTGQALSGAEADAWFGRYTALFEAAWTVFPDVPATLEALPYRQGILSNSSTGHQERRMAVLGLRHHFEVLLCSDTLRCAKPDPAAFLAGCAALGLPPAAVAYVGDRLDVDAVGAHEAGLVGIWLDRGRTAVRVPDGVHRIPDLGELPRLLTSL